MPEHHKEAVAAALEHYGMSIVCGLRTGDDPQIDRLAATITAAYAPRFAAYGELHRASRVIDKLGGVLGDDDVLTHEERRAVVEFKAALVILKELEAQ